MNLKNMFMRRVVGNLELIKELTNI